MEEEVDALVTQIGALKKKEEPSPMDEVQPLAPPKQKTYRDIVVEKRQSFLSARNKAMMAPIEAYYGSIIQ